jgi:hypothetical protein
MKPSLLLREVLSSKEKQSFHSTLLFSFFLLLSLDKYHVSIAIKCTVAHVYCLTSAVISGKTRPSVGDERDGLMLWRVAGTMVNKRSMTADKGWSSNLRLLAPHIQKYCHE